MAAEKIMTVPQEALLGPEPFPDVKTVRMGWEHITSRIAFMARERVLREGTLSQHLAQNPSLDKKAVKGRLISGLDNSAVRIIRGEIESNLHWVTDVRSCEGHKERGKYGETFELLSGRYGQGEEQVDVDLDPIEGTDFTADDVPGGMSFAAISQSGGIIDTPKDDGGEKEEDGSYPDIDYMEKLAGPVGLRGKISLEQSPLDNLRATASHYGIDPRMITVVSLDRSRNKEVIEAVKAFGAQFRGIDAGDLEPSLRALIEPEDPKRRGVQLLMGSGGWQEGVGTAVAARVWGSVFEGQTVLKRTDENGKEYFVRHGKVLTLDRLVRGKAENSLVVFSSITGIQEFDMPEVDIESCLVTSFSTDVSSPNGFYKVRKHFLPQGLSM